MERKNAVTVAIISPEWLREPLSVLLQAVPCSRLWAHATSTEHLLALRPEEPPDLVIILVYEGDDIAHRLQRIAAAWPGVRSIALVESASQQSVAREAGADVVLNQGAAPGRLMDAVCSFRPGLGEVHA